jgi:methylthioribose-1-phosphate isomerase
VSEQAAAVQAAAEDPIPPTIEWRGERVRLIDQRQLPGRLVFVEATTVDDLCALIQAMAVRGAPALGAAGAMGVALAAIRGEPLADAVAQLVGTRPTAANLAWGARRAAAAADPVAEAQRIAEEDVAVNRRIGAAGAGLVPAGARVLTHCNAGALACVGYGTAIGVIRAAHEAGRALTVWVGETRPLRQGARLTAWELQRLAIPCSVVADSLAASLMATGDVDLVVVGADRIAANGDVANKVGTYGLAVVARHHGVPFYVAAPRSTFDDQCPMGADVVIERRPSEELGEVPPGVAVENRAFDITPAELVTAWITEDGISTSSSAAESHLLPRPEG